MRKYLSLLLVAILAVSIISAAGVVTTKKAAAVTYPYYYYPTLWVLEPHGNLIGSMSTSQSNFVLGVVSENVVFYYFKPTYMRANIGCAFCVDITSLSSSTTFTRTNIKTVYTNSAGWAKDANGNPIGYVGGYLPTNVVTAIKSPSSYSKVWYVIDRG
jgi:hypothetical protein